MGKKDQLNNKAKKIPYLLFQNKDLDKEEMPQYIENIENLELINCENLENFIKKLKKVKNLILRGIDLKGIKLNIDFISKVEIICCRNVYDFFWNYRNEINIRSYNSNKIILKNLRSEDSWVKEGERNKKSWGKKIKKENQIQIN